MILSEPEPLAATHDVSQFSCGKPQLDHWLKTRARANQEKGFTAVLAVHARGRVVGFYGLSPTAVVPDRFPARSARDNRPTPSPAFFTVNLRPISRGRGVGTGLLKHALQRSVAAAKLIGGRALMVNAIDAEAAEFWRRRGFLASRDDPLVLFRSMAALAEAAREAAR